MDSARTQGADAGARLLNRRQLLTIGSLVAVAPLFPQLAWADEAWADESVTTAVANGFRPLSVGYIEQAGVFVDTTMLLATFGRMGRLETADAIGLRVVAADLLSRGDASLAGQTLRARIHGFCPFLGSSEANPIIPDHGVELDVLVPSPEGAPGAERLPFYAWSYRPDGPSQSQSISFALPVERESPPELRLTIRRAGGEAVTYLARFTVDDEPGRPRLRRGLYLLPLDAEPWLRGDDKLAAWGNVAMAKTPTVLMSFDVEAASAA